MQDRGSCNPFVRALVIWSGALAGLMMILVGGLFPSALIIPGLNLSPRLFSLSSTWQVPSLLIAALGAKGITEIHNINQIDRGYETIDKRLNALGAKILRVRE